MKRLVAVTGAAGHLGRYVVSDLISAGERVRAFLLPGESYIDPNPANQEAPDIFYGDIRNPDDAARFLAHDPGVGLSVVHCAGMISISDQADPLVYDVNVNGTRTILDMARECGVRRFVYVSSVHAIPELPKGTVQTEISRFDPDQVVGDYARTKAIATQLVLDAAADGFDALVVHPSGIIGPNSLKSGKMTKLANDFLKGRLPVAVDGGFDFVDVRDVSCGIVAALRKGRAGETYLLTNRFFSIREILDCYAKLTGARRTKIFLPPRFVSFFAPLIEWVAKLRETKPLFTKYSMYALAQNALFSHEKADSELGYVTRGLEETLRDTVNWIKGIGGFR